MEGVKPELGVCYYPEHWSPEQVPVDAEKMIDMGLSWVRIGEFAWSRMEPNPGKFDWAWLDNSIETLGKAGLKIIMSTPTATPPRWMLGKHPDMLAFDINGAPRKFGSRRHYCFSHQGYRDESVRIAGLLGERYGKSPHIHAWQIDNEYGCHETVLSYSPSAHDAFQSWLAHKYGTIEALNSAWGNVFWSMEYGAFAEIDLPNQTVTEPNPAHQMDFRRFSSDQVILFNRAQVETMRPLTDAPLIHNYMGRVLEFDHFAVGEDLDIASWDSYPLGFLEDRSDQSEEFKHAFMRQGDPDFQAFHHDLYRAVGKGRWWVLEQQPGPVNWAPFNPAPLPGMVRLWTWEAFAHSAEMVSYFRWRQAPFAQEQLHSALQLPNGESAAVAKEIEQISHEINLLGDIVHEQASVALVFDYASAWAWETQPQGQDFDYFKLVYAYYAALRKLGLSIDILPPNTDCFGDRKLILIPGLFCWTDELTRAVQSFDGQVLIGPRTGSKTADFQIPQVLPPNMEGFALKVTSVETLRPTAKVKLQDGGSFHIWREQIETSEEIVERAEDGTPAAIRKDNVTYIGGWPDETAMSRVLTDLAKQSGLSTVTLEAGYRQRSFGDFTLHMNYGTKPVSLLTGGEGTQASAQIGAGDIAIINNRTKERLI